MIEDVHTFAGLMFHGFVRLLPYVLLTIPIAVAVQLSGAARHIRRAFAARPLPAIILATILGAFSPFCSCGVIPVIASLLIGGVPLAPVMSFWIASPSMDPEIFFLSVATLGWDLALWRLLSTLVLSLGAGFITHVAVQRAWISGPILRSGTFDPARASVGTFQTALQWARRLFPRAVPDLAGEVCCSGTGLQVTATGQTSAASEVLFTATRLPELSSCSTSCGSCAGSSPSQTSQVAQQSFSRRVIGEGGAAALMVGKFMLLALVIEALFALYVPQEWVVSIVGQNSRFAILSAALIGVPLYTSNLTALPMIGVLLGQGMNPSAALAFLIAGPTTTIPAMAAVWGLVSRRVFALYVGFALFGAVLAGLLHRIASLQ